MKVDRAKKYKDLESLLFRVKGDQLVSLFWQITLNLKKVFNFRG